MHNSNSLMLHLIVFSLYCLCLSSDAGALVWAGAPGEGGPVPVRRSRRLPMNEDGVRGSSRARPGEARHRVYTNRSALQ